MANKYKYLIFDFDGTLADTREPIICAYKITYEAMGVPVPSDAEISAGIGMTLEDVFLSTVEGATPEMAKEAVRIYRQTFADISLPLTVAFPGVREALEELRGHGYSMSVASSRSHTSLETLASHIGVDKYFDILLGAEDVARHKPAPDMVLQLLDRLQLDAGKVLVIGDASFDILMAHGAGCDACGVTWGNQTREQLLSASPEYLIDSILELPRMLNE